MNSFGIGFDDLPSKVQNDLNTLVAVKLQSGLIDADMTYIREWFCKRVKDKMMNETAIGAIQVHIAMYSNQIADARKTIEQADK